MDSTRLTEPPRRLDSPDAALLAAFALIAVLGTWQKCLLVNDGAVYLAAAWLGNAWDLFYSQNTGRVVSTLLQFGPAWALRPLFGGDAVAFIVVAHALYFAIPMVLWLIVRAVEPHRIYSRLYLAIVLVLIQFTSEMVQGIGLWMIWLALVADLARSSRAKAVASAVMAVILALTHPGIALLSLAFGACGVALILLRRPFSRDLGDRGPGDGDLPSGRVCRDRRDVGADQSDDRRAARRGEVRLHRSALDVRHARPLSAVGDSLAADAGARAGEHGGALAPVTDGRAGRGRHRPVVCGRMARTSSPGSSPARRRPMCWPWRSRWRWPLHRRHGSKRRAGRLPCSPSSWRSLPSRTR